MESMAVIHWNSLKSYEIRWKPFEVRKYSVEFIIILAAIHWKPVIFWNPKEAIEIHWNSIESTENRLKSNKI